MNIRCAHCKNRHTSIMEVRRCAGEMNEQAAQAKAEMEAEARAERFYEEGPHGPTPDDPREVHAQMLDDIRREEARSRAIKAEAGDEPDLLTALRDSTNAVHEMELDEEERAAARLDAMTGNHGRDMASDKQVKYIMDLLDQRVWPHELREHDISNMERRQATKLIDALKSSPLKDMPSVEDWGRFKNIPAGRYCIEADDGTLRFYQVDRPDQGKWAGRMFTKQLLGAPGAYRKINIPTMSVSKVLNVIVKDPREASIRYGKESRECGVCHSPLTNQASLERGIGPVCAGKRGW